MGLASLAGAQGETCAETVQEEDPQQRLSRRKEGRTAAGRWPGPGAEFKGHQDSIALKKTNWCRFFLFS